MRPFNSWRDTPHVLFLTEKWCDCNPEAGLTNSSHNLFDSLASTGLATQTHFHFDEYVRRTETRGDQAFVEFCQSERPDLIVWSYAFAAPDIFNPQTPALEFVSQRLGIPIIGVWFDTIQPGVVETAETLAPYLLFNVVLDSCTYYLDKTRSPEKYLPMWTPEDPKLFFPGTGERDIDVSFVGSVMNYPDRQQAMAALALSGIAYLQSGGQREHRLTPEAYAELHRRSKIGLNFSDARGRGAQVKGRVFEILLSGTMLMESANPETEKWLTPMVDYVPFDSTSDMLDKIRYYLAHEDERALIAAAGLKIAQSRYSAQHFWQFILDEALYRKLALGFVRSLGG